MQSPSTKVYFFLIFLLTFSTNLFFLDLVYLFRVPLCAIYLMSIPGLRDLVGNQNCSVQDQKSLDGQCLPTFRFRLFSALFFETDKFLPYQASPGK